MEAHQAAQPRQSEPTTPTEQAFTRLGAGSESAPKPPLPEEPYASRDARAAEGPTREGGPILASQVTERTEIETGNDRGLETTGSKLETTAQPTSEYESKAAEAAAERAPVELPIFPGHQPPAFAQALSTMQEQQGGRETPPQPSAIGESIRPTTTYLSQSLQNEPPIPSQGRKPSIKIPAAEMTPEALELARRRETEPETVKPIAHMIALEDVTPDREQVPAATVHPAILPRTTWTGAASEPETAVPAVVATESQIPFATTQHLVQPQSGVEQAQRDRDRDRDRSAQLQDRVRSLESELSGLCESNGRMEGERELLLKRVTELTEIVETRINAAKDDIWNREDMVRDLELMAQQVGSEPGVRVSST